MHIAVEGCCHGALDRIYETMQNMEKRDNIKIDLLLCCGDFQAVRDEADLSSMAVPDKYKSMESFWQYYNGTKKAPYLTIFIGGNHEASNHLQELPYGGWVAPNIYYMGYANVINYKGIRIGGISGIFKYHDYNKGHFEKAPYDNSTKRSVYHVRSSEVFKLKLLQNPVDIMMSHDWPNGIVHYGNIPYLIRRKPFFEADIQRNRLGSPPLMELLQHMKPKHWFSGHLHVKFTAKVCHDPPAASPGQRPPRTTDFLALDKCLPRRDFLQVIKIDPPQNSVNSGLSYDPEWLSVLQATDNLLSVSRRFVNLPNLLDNSDFSQHRSTEKQVENATKLFNGDLSIPLNFKCDISPLYDPQNHNRYKPVQCRTSHQTVEFCNKLKINDPLAMAIAAEGGDLSLSFNSSSFMEDDEIPSTIISATSINEDEIDLDSDEDDNNNGKESEGNCVESEIAGNNNDNIKANESVSVLSDAMTPGVAAKKGQATRLSLNLPPPVFGATSTPIRTDTASHCDSNSSIPIDFENTPIKPPARLEHKNALLMGLRGKRLSDTDSDTTSEQSPGNAKVQKTFKRRNASLYVSQDESETS